MKRLLTLLALSITIVVQSQSIQPLGWCNGRAYFKTVGFPNNYQVQIQVVGQTVPFADYITPASGSTEYIFDVAQPSQNILVSVEYRFRNRNNSNWPNPWKQYQSISTLYGQCVVLPVRILRPTWKWLDDYTVEIALDIQTIEGETSVEFKFKGKSGKVYPTFYYTIKATDNPGKYIIQAVYTGSAWLIQSTKRK